MTERDPDPDADVRRLAARHETVAFDVSASAVRLARERFPDSPVDYVTADLLDPPAAWRHAFELVVEIMTVQALPEELHARATRAWPGSSGQGARCW